MGAAVGAGGGGGRGGGGGGGGVGGARGGGGLGPAPAVAPEVEAAPPAVAIEVEAAPPAVEVIEDENTEEVAPVADAVVESAELAPALVTDADLGNGVGEETEGAVDDAVVPEQEIGRAHV